jgi:hypothetical protein
MALVIKDRIKETSTTTGTGTLTLAGASTGFKAFSEIGSGNTTYYAISDGTDWEVGLGTVGSGTLSRDTILASSNAGSAVSWNSDVKDVFCTYPADKAVYLDASGNFNISGGDITFGDNDKAIFGAGSDLQIYHDGTHSYVQDAGTGNLVLKSSDTVIQSNTAETMAVFNGNGSVDLYYNNSKKLATTNTGVDITGTLTSDGLTVDGDVTLGNGATLNIDDQDSIVFGTYSGGSTGTLLQGGTSTDYSIRVAGRLRQNISTGGDISFYEDTGTTPKFFWDASAESLGIGTSSPSAALHISSPSNARGLKLQNSSSISASQITFLSDDGTEDSYIRNQASNSGQDILSLGTGGAERMRIDSNGNVGIGTTPSGYLTSGYVLRLNSSSTQTYLAFNNSTYTTQVTGGFVIGMDNASANIIQRENLPIKVYTNDTERMRIDSSGNVGIGTSSPTEALHIQNGSLNLQHSSGTPTIRMNDEGIGSCYIKMPDGSNSLTVETGGTERMRIDSSGNLLVGKTALSSSTAGFQVESDGAAVITRSGNFPLILNRSTSNGGILQFRKDGTTVGSIGANGGDVYIGTGDTGVRFVDSLDCLLPLNTSTNATRDAAIDIGYNDGGRFKDLYLSGGVYLGGTGSANYLDDYEEGTWTAVLKGATSDPTVSSYTVRHGYYIKVGQLVWVSFYIYCNGTVSGGAGSIRIGGIPFTIKNSSLSGYQSIQIGYANVSGSAVYPDTTNGTHSNPRWQANNSDVIQLYGVNRDNWGSTYELSGSGVLFVA